MKTILNLFIAFVLCGSYQLCEAQPIKIKGFYATSTGIPQEQYSILNLLDEDLSTFWSTMPGAGPGEGIMIYFEKPETVSSIKINQFQKPGYASVRSITYYVNGASPNTQSLKEDNDLVINADKVSSLYLKIEETSNLNKEMNEYILVRRFENIPLALSDLYFYNSSGEKRQVILPTIIKANVEASSTLEPTLSYGIQNLFDGKKEFAWVEGASGDGVGESITVTVNQPIEPMGLKIANGFQRSKKHFTANARVKRITISDRAQRSSVIQIKDEEGEQIIKFDQPIRSDKFVLTIDQAFPGTAYKDLVISELKFIDREGEILIDPQISEKQKQDMKSKAQGTALENLLDRQIHNTLEDMDGYERSIILRSDNTFVCYNKSWDDTSNSEVIAEGNWQVKELGSNTAKLRVFGKLTRVSEIMDYYKGNSESSYYQIFQDYLTISTTQITGEKFIEDFKIK